MTTSIDSLRRIRDAHNGLRKVDLLIRNVQCINTLTQEIHPVSLSIDQGKIISFEEMDAEAIVEGNNRYAAPLFTDAHMHIESTALLPGVLNDILLPRGVGRVVCDPHEIANVAGTAGIDLLLDAAAVCDLDFRFMLPSCVPSTVFEHAGAILSADDLKPYYDHPMVLGLAEVMDVDRVRSEEDMLHKLADAHEANSHIDGHGSVLDNAGIDLFASLDIKTDHECTEANGFHSRLRRGIWTFVREGSVTKNLDALIHEITLKNYRKVCFCTDDKHPDDLVKEGGIDSVVRKAINQGLDPVMAITLATLNPSLCYDSFDTGALAPGYTADFFLFDDLKTLIPSVVYKKGVKVAENGQVLRKCQDLPVLISERLTHSVNPAPYLVSDLQISAEGCTKMNMIEVSGGNVLTKRIVEEIKVNILGNFEPDVARDHAKLVVMERHHALGNIGVCPVKGFGLFQGAIATTVAHDSHNIIAVGTNDFDIVMAIEQVKKNQGGYVVAADGKIWAAVHLEIGGLMTSQPLTQLLEQMEELHRNSTYVLTKQDFNPFLMLSFISLPVIPEVKLTDIGCIDVLSSTVLKLPVHD